MGDDVCVAKEGEGDPLALARLQRAVERQDVENLEVGEERPRCRASKSMQKSSRGSQRRTDMAGEASSSNTGKNHARLILHPFRLPVEGPWGKIFSHPH